ncbi:MAG TPA: RecX family transcriptional regulator [Thermodesulfovibrionales bacterium]|nr:RecX family transcriptional regulator [Thermodesulfovibrionales bacterium]
MTVSDDKAKQYSLKLLSYRGRSEKELEERLRKKGVSARGISSTMRYLKDTGLLNDLSLAESLKREALTYRMLSQAGARYFMLRRGIPRSIVDSVLSNDDNIDIDNAVKFVDKKLRVLGKYPAETAKRRLYNLLLRRGYSSGTILKVLKEKIMKEEEK